MWGNLSWDRTASINAANLSLLQLCSVSSKSKTWRSFQRWRHCRDKMLVRTAYKVGRNERMWHNNEFGRLLIMSVPMLLFDAVDVSAISPNLRVNDMQRTRMSEEYQE
ncbi:hypothetical protein AAHE18_09G029000 [Arachis hypogaea]